MEELVWWGIRGWFFGLGMEGYVILGTNQMGGGVVCFCYCVRVQLLDIVIRMYVCVYKRFWHARAGMIGLVREWWTNGTWRHMEWEDSVGVMVSFSYVFDSVGRGKDTMHYTDNDAVVVHHQH